MKTWLDACDSEIRSYEAISRVFSKHQYLLNGFFEEKQPRLSFPPEEMIAQTAGFSDGEIVLIKVALDIWSGSGNALVWQLLETLDKRNFMNVLDGLIIVRSSEPTLVSPPRDSTF